MNPVTANFSCFCAMIMWAVGFPAAEILLESWGAISLLFIRMLLGAFVFIPVAYAIALLAGYTETHIGSIDGQHLILLLIFSLVSLALAQLLWIWGAGHLGILLASFHMNAVPFYVMGKI